MLGIDIFGIAKKEVLKQDANKNNIPDALEALDAGEAALDVLANFVSVFDRFDVTELIATLPPRIRGKIHPATTAAVGEAIEKLPAALRVAKQVLEGLEVELKRK